MTYHILIVEDNPANAFLLEESVKTFAGAQSYLAVNKEEFKAALTARNYDLIFLDYMLPDVYGTELIKTIRESKKDVPIVMVTGKSETYDKEVAMLHGATDYIVKPISAEQVREIMDKLLKKE